jgi:hypothetical protein
LSKLPAQPQHEFCVSSIRSTKKKELKKNKLENNNKHTAKKRIGKIFVFLGGRE